MPVVDERHNNSIQNTMNEDLRLQGDKIKLELRPMSRETSTASAKCAYLLQGPQRSARPVSAVPMLSLYENNKDEYQLTQKIRRPYSADNLSVMGSRHERVFFKQMNSNPLDKFTNSCSSLQSIEEIDKDSMSSLPSSELLKTLIDEPIASWRRRPDRFDSPLSEESRHRSVELRRGPSQPKDELIASDNSLRNIHFKSQRTENKSVNCFQDSKEVDAIAVSSELTPGLKSKPPLPPPSTQTVSGVKQTENKHHRQITYEQPEHEQKWINEMLVDEIDLEENAVCETETQTNFYLKEIKGMKEEHGDLPSVKVNTTKMNANTDADNASNRQQQLSEVIVKRKENMCDTELLLDKLREEQQQLLEQKIIAQEKELGIFHEDDSKHIKFEKESGSKESGDAFEIPQIKFQNVKLDNDKFERFFGEQIPSTTRSETIVTLKFPQTHREKLPQRQRKQPGIQKHVHLKHETMRAQNSVKFEPIRSSSAKNCKRPLSTEQTNISKQDLQGKLSSTARINTQKFHVNPIKSIKINHGEEKIKECQIDETDSWMSKTNGSVRSSASSIVTPVGSGAQEALAGVSSNGSSKLMSEKISHETISSDDMNKDTFATCNSETDSKTKLQLEPFDDIKITDVITDEDCDLTNDTSWGSDPGNTCDDIEAILEVLEQESQKSHSQIESIKKIVNRELNASINSISADYNVMSSSPKVLERNSKMKTKTTIVNPEKMPTKEDNVVNDKEMEIPKDLQSNNFNEILNFLDEVERSNEQTISTAKERIELSKQLISNAIRLDSIPQLEHLLNYTQVELANQIIDLNLRLKDKSSSIKVLQDELSNLRDLAMKTQKHTAKLVKDKLKAQKEESDSVIKRHQSFIDQLMSDKKALHEQCEGLLKEMKSLDEKFTNNFKAIEHKHTVELKKAKDMHLAGEKIRRERWIDSKTQKIKELTVKSIEPELQAMTVRHERELSDLRALHKHEIEDIEMTNARKSQQQLEALREQLTKEREQSLMHEREVLRVRYESMIQAEEKSYQEQRKRLMTEQAVRYGECETREQVAYAERDKMITQAREEYENSIRGMEMKHMRAIEIVKENAELEFGKWKCAWKKQQEIGLAKKEEAIKEQYKVERDREIERVIERLENEMQNNKIQIEIATDSRLRRQKEKYENEIKDLEASESQFKDKFAMTKGKLLEYEELIENLQSSIKHLEQQVTHTSRMYQELASEKKHLQETIREEMRYEMVQLERQVERVKQERDTDLSQVYGRVKVAVARKDEMLAELSRDHVSLKEKCKYLEKMLEQQRKEYLIKN